MTPHIELSERAYERLGQWRRSDESWSQAIERLKDGQSRDPLRFVELMRRYPLTKSARQLMREVEEEREASREPA